MTDRQAATAAIPANFNSVGDDRAAIEAQLATYTHAVSTKNRALFETLLLEKTVTFSWVPTADEEIDGKLSNYDAFCKGVFEGTPFTQSFRNVHIEQDGKLAAVTLVFVNTRPHSESWGWKALQLLKVDGTWKIVSELYTSHK